jgi:hypothetical protein
MHLKNPHAHWEMIEGLKSRYRVEECIFNIVIGKFEGHKISVVSRKVAEKIEIQTRYAAQSGILTYYLQSVVLVNIAAKISDW